MNNSELNANILALPNAPIFKRLIKSEFLLRDGTKSQIVTMLPCGNTLEEEVVFGLNQALKTLGVVVMVQHSIFHCKDGEMQESDIYYYPRIFSK